MSRYESQVLAALRAVEVRLPDAYLWFGRRTAAAPLQAAVAARLLADFQPSGAPRAPGDDAAGPGDGGSFVRALSHANNGRGAWEPGWRVAATAEDAVDVVRADGLLLRAPHEDCRVAGDIATVRLPKELMGLVPGWYLAAGDHGRPAGELLRLHWTLAAPGAPSFVKRVTYALNGAELPFDLELVADPARYARGGCAALLIRREDFPATMRLLRPLMRALQLGEGSPAFAKPLARGLSVAEEPSAGEGFAAHRCRLLAEAVVAAGEAGLQTATERLAAVRERFRDDGIDLDAPYLEPGSADDYAAS
ncbi:MAG TPA: T3SS effector HopA1 family protein [Solirubrobacteraceae bacterium]|nr:T3SS effector HopA1 family protein [Solirubrobacteraceae bacterium]